jgi:hypothetical protein
MPSELLTFPPAYCVVGAFRLARDPLLWKPMWKRCASAAKRAGLIAVIWVRRGAASPDDAPLTIAPQAVVTWPVQRWFVGYFMSGSARISGLSSVYGSVVGRADRLDGASDSSFLGFAMPSLTTFAALVFVLGQCNSIMDFWLRRKLKECRNEAYQATVSAEAGERCAACLADMRAQVKSRGKGDEWWTPYFEECVLPFGNDWSAQC